MSRQILSALAVITLLAALTPAHGQTISARPMLFKDPVWGVDPKQGEVVLGRTTLNAALRIFAVELEEDSVRVPLGHEGNPARLAGTELFVGGAKIRPHHRLILGRDRYTLYFDENLRLIAVVGSPETPRALRRQELEAKYPSLRVSYRGHNADGVLIYEGLEAPLGECISLTAARRPEKDETMVQGYVFSCATKPALAKTTRSASH